MSTWWDGWERRRLAREVMPFPAQTKGERAFKLAALELILDGIYPSGRQIKKRLGKDVGCKVNLNGRECGWLAEIRELFSIEPYFGYSRKWLRPEMPEHYPFKLCRGPHGALVVREDWLTNRLADRQAVLR